jgi:hypothetical protein
MGPVEMADQMREYYGVGRSSKNWRKYIFHFIMNVSIVNSVITSAKGKQDVHTATHSTASGGTSSSS